MRRSSSLIAIFLVGSLMAFAAASAAANLLRTCDKLQPVVTREMTKAGQPAVAVIVFDVTGSGRVVDQQLIGPETPWAELAQKTLSEKLFEPLVEGDIGIRRVGVTMSFVAEFQGRGQSCGRVMAPVTPNLEIRVCVTR